MALTNWYATYTFVDDKKERQDVQVGIAAATNDTGYLAAVDAAEELIPLLTPLSEAKLVEWTLTRRIPLAGTPAAVTGSHVENKATYVWDDPDGFEIGFSIPCPPDAIFDTNRHDVTMTNTDVSDFMDLVVTGPYFNMRGVAYTTKLRGYFVTRSRKHSRV